MDLRRITISKPDFGTQLIKRIVGYLMQPQFANTENFIKFVSSEKGTKDFGLGFSKGGKASSPKGPNKDAVRKFLTFLPALANSDQKYLNFGLLQNQLSGLGRDGISDMIINIFLDVFKEESDKLIEKIEKNFAKECGDSGLEIITDHEGHKFLKLGNAKRFLINASYLSNMSFESSDDRNINEIKDFTEQKDSDFGTKISNSDLRTFLQEIASFALQNFEANEVQNWKKYIDNIEAYSELKKTIKNPVAFFRYIDREGNIDIPAVANIILSNSRSERPSEAEISNVFKALLKFENYIYDAENQTSIGAIDIFLVKQNTILEIKSIEQPKEQMIKDHIGQLENYLDTERYFGSRGILLLFIDRQSKNLIHDVIENYKSMHKIEVVISDWNYKTASKIKKDENYKRTETMNIKSLKQ